MSPESITVAIPTWRRAPWLARCLTSLARQSLQPDEVLIIGRAEDIDAQEVAHRAWPWRVRWVTVDRPGHVAPIERAVEYAEGHLLAIVDDDVELHPEWLARLTSNFVDPAIACVGGRVVTPGLVATVHRDAGSVRWYGRHIGNVAAQVLPRPIDVATVMECNWAWRVDVLRKLRFEPDLDFREAIGYGLDLCLQARERGCLVVYDAAAVVYNVEAPRDPASSIVRTDRLAKAESVGRNYAFIAARRGPRWRAVTYPLWALLVGEASSPGLLRALMTLKGSPDPVTAFRVAARSTVSGTLLGLRARRSDTKGS